MIVRLVDYKTFEAYGQFSVCTIDKLVEFLSTFGKAEIHHCSIGGGKLYIYIKGGFEK